MSDDLFDTTPKTPVTIDPNKDYFPELVGEGKRYTDTKAVGRAIVEKDAMIEQLKRETAALRADANARMKMEDFIDKMQSLQAATPTQDATPAPAPMGDGRPQMKPEEVAELVDQRVAAREKANQRTRNLMEVSEALKARFGDAYASVVEEKANQLGLGKEFLNQLAAEHPKAFFATIGLDQRPVAAMGTPPRSSVDSGAFKPASDEKTKSYYDNILKTDRNKYLSREVQLEMHRQALKLGEAFYK